MQKMPFFIRFFYILLNGIKQSIGVRWMRKHTALVICTLFLSLALSLSSRISRANAMHCKKRHEEYDEHNEKCRLIEGTVPPYIEYAIYSIKFQTVKTHAYLPPAIKINSINGHMQWPFIWHERQRYTIWSSIIADLYLALENVIDICLWLLFL